MTITAGGGTVTLLNFLIGLGVASLLSSLFVITGRQLLIILGAFKDNKISHSGYCFFLGVSLFFVLMQALAGFGMSFRSSLMWTTLLFASLISVSIIAAVDTRLELLNCFKYIAFTIVAVFLVSFVLNYISSKRGGPLYAEMAEYIVSANFIPVLNRHRGQSLLAAVVMLCVDSYNQQIARMAVNLWLPISHLFLLCVVFNLIKSQIKSISGQMIVCAFAFAGNCALSVMPYIPSDHDFPLIYNIYADSVIGLGVCLLVISLCNVYVHMHLKFTSRQLIGLLLLYVALTSFHITAELNLLVVAVALIPFFIVSTIRGKLIRSIIQIALILIIVLCAFFSSQFMGGIFAPRDALQAANGPYRDKILDDSGASESSQKIRFDDISQWYVPFDLPGFYRDFGNFESVLDAALLDRKTPYRYKSLNNYLLNESDQFPMPLGNTTKIGRALYIADERLTTIVKVLFWVFFGAGGCLFMLKSRQTKPFSVLADERFRNVLFENSGIVFALTSFVIGLSVIFANSDGGWALFWKWALTRLNEIGFFLMMIWCGITVVKLCDRISSVPLRALIATLIISLLLVGTISRLVVYSLRLPSL